MSRKDDVAGSVKRTFGQFTLPQRTLVVIGVAILALGAAAFVSWTSRPTMSPLFTNLAPADASAVVDSLEAEGVPYELTAGGTTVLVPEESMYRLRISLASAGVPGSTDGYSLLDDMGMTSSDFQQQVTYKRAVEGELARTIGSITGVSAATVHLAIPEQSVFVERATAPTASVFVQLRSGAQLDTDAVRAIINLVSNSIPDMAPEGVSVIDAEGRVLSDDSSGASTTTDYENGVSANVQAMLDRVVGPGKAVVTVRADVNRDSTQRVTETYTPATDAPPLSSSRSTETYTGTGSPVGGVLGPDNIAVPGNTDGGGTYSSEDEVLNNAVNKVTEQTSVAPGGVSRQSVSVVVDTQAAAGIDLTDLEAMVAAAAGVDEARGDRVVVSRMTFDTSTAAAAQEALTAATAAAEASRNADLMRDLITAGVLLVVVVLLVFAAKAMVGGRRETIDLGELEAVTSLRDQLAAFESSAAAGNGLPAGTPTAQLGAAPAAGPGQGASGSLAAEDPSVVAASIRDWLAVKR